MQLVLTILPTCQKYTYICLSTSHVQDWNELMQTLEDGQALSCSNMTTLSAAPRPFNSVQSTNIDLIPADQYEGASPCMHPGSRQLWDSNPRNHRPRQVIFPWTTKTRFECAVSIVTPPRFLDCLGDHSRYPTGSGAEIISFAARTGISLALALSPAPPSWTWPGTPGTRRRGWGRRPTMALMFSPCNPST